MGHTVEAYKVETVGERFHDLPNVAVYPHTYANARPSHRPIFQPTRPWQPPLLSHVHPHIPTSYMVDGLGSRGSPYMHIHTSTNACMGRAVAPLDPTVAGDCYMGP
eukprot:364955-Chlamydomonas_euryale.AAC.15